MGDWCIHINLLLHSVQIPVSVGVTLYEALSLYSGKRVIASKADSGTRPGVKQLIVYCSCGVLAGVVGGLLGLGGGFIMGPLFLELGVPPQVSLLFLYLSSEVVKKLLLVLLDDEILVGRQMKR